MILKDIIKLFDFVESNRDRIDITGGLRLNPGRSMVDLPRLELPRQAAPADDLYDTSTALTAKTWLTTPMSIKEWRGFEAVVTQKADPDGGGVIVTSAFYRLGDGVDEFYWDGGAWAVATPTDWSDEADVANNIATFPATAKALEVIVNLRTSDERVTPELAEIKVLYGASIDHMEDYLTRSLIPDLKANVRPAGRTKFSFGGGTSVVEEDYKPETPYNIKGVDAVWDENADPAHLFDLFSSFDLATGEITLTSDPGVTRLFIRFLYEPVVARTTSRDYSEVSKVPSLKIENVRLTNAGIRGNDDSVVNKDAGTAVKVHGVRQGDIEFDLVAETDKIVDQDRLAEAARDYMASNPLLVSRGMDERFRLWLVDEYDQIGGPNNADISAGRLRAKIVGAVFFERGSDTSASAVSSFKTSPNSNLTLQVP